MENETLLILPGWGLDSSVLSGVRNHLAKRFEIAEIDWSVIGSRNEIGHMVADAVSKIGKRRISVLGWSMGAIAAIEVAAELKDAVSSLILISPTSSFCVRPDDGYDFGWKSSFVERLKKRVVSGREKALDGFYESMFTGDEIGFIDEFKEKARLAASRYSIESLSAGLDYLRDADLRHALSEIDVPTLIIQGRCDTVCPPDGALYVYDNIGQRKLIHIIDNSGHAPFITNEHVCIAKVDEFLENYR